MSRATGLRVNLLLRPYDHMTFHLEERTITHPNGEIHQEILDFTELSDDSELELNLFSAIRQNLKRLMPENHVGRPDERRRHHFIQVNKPVGRGRTMDVIYATVLWEIQRYRKKTVHHDGRIEFFENPRKVPFDDFLQWEDSRHDNGGQPTSRKGTLCLCCPDGGSELINIEVFGKPSETLIMEATALDNSFALKFTLTMPLPGAKEDADLPGGVLDIMSKGLTGPTRRFVYLSDLVFVLWLIYNEEDKAYIEFYR